MVAGQCQVANDEHAHARPRDGRTPESSRKGESSQCGNPTRSEDAVGRGQMLSNMYQDGACNQATCEPRFPGNATAP